MPIYAYKCDSCGFAKDVLQKMSDPQLTQCPSCGAPAFKKQLTAAGFQLKGSGWYATDFKDGGKKADSASGEDKSGNSGDAQSDAKSDAKLETKSDGKSDGKSDSKSEGKSEAKTDNKPEAKKADAPVARKPDAAPAA